MSEDQNMQALSRNVSLAMRMGFAAVIIAVFMLGILTGSHMTREAVASQMGARMQAMQMHRGERRMAKRQKAMMRRKAQQNREQVQTTNQ